MITVESINYGKIRDERFTKEVMGGIVKAIEAGMSRESACALVQISEEELVRWIGMSEEVGKLVKSSEAKYMMKLLEVVGMKVEDSPEFAFKVLASKYDDFQRKAPRVKESGKGNLVNKLIELSKVRDG